MLKCNSIKIKLTLTIVMVSIAMAVCIGGFFIYNIVETGKKGVSDYRQELSEEVDSDLKAHTEVVLSAVKDIYAKQQAGILTEEQAKAAAADLVRKMNYDDGKGYFAVDTYDGVVVSLLGRDIEGKSRIDSKDPNGKYFIKELIEKGRRPGGGYTDFMFAKPNETTPLPKRNYSIAFEPYHWVIEHGVWIDYIDSKVAARQASETASLQKSIITVIIYILIIEAILICVAIYVGKKFSDPIKAVTKELNILATGDFHNKIEGSFLQRKDEIGAMGQALAALHKNVRVLLSKITDSVQYLSSSVEELTSSADQSAKASNQVAESMVNVAQLCGEQFKATEGTESKTNELSDHMQHFMSNIKESGEQTEKASKAADNGNKEVSAAVSKMRDIEQSVSVTAQAIDKLGKESEKIGSIVDTIGTIAEQTNLLALNAAIEAARAGEQGKGFAVVAEEVRKLAEQSQTAAAEIEELIKNIQAETQNAVQVMQQGVGQVKQGTDVVDNAGSTFSDIVHMVEQIAKRSNEMENIVADLTEGSGKIAENVGKIGTMSHSVSSEAETVSAATQQQTASMNEIAESSRKLSKMAQDLQNEVNKFKI